MQWDCAASKLHAEDALVLSGRLRGVFGGRNTSSALIAASMVAVERCPPMLIGPILLERVPARVAIFESNKRLLESAGGAMTSLPALDGSNATRFLEFWRASGYRLAAGTKKARGWMRSYGAVSATLSHLDAMRGQLSRRVPYLLRLEDDIHIVNASLVRALGCFATRYLRTSEAAARGNDAAFGGFDAIHFNFGGPGGMSVGADVYLTSIAGARAQLRRLCTTGIYSGFDFMTNKDLGVLHVATTATRLLFRRQNAPTGKGSVVKGLRHFNYSELRDESAGWGVGRCMQWSRA